MVVMPTLPSFRQGQRPGAGAVEEEEDEGYLSPDLIESFEEL
jgi:hypothetical protein